MGQINSYFAPKKPVITTRVVDGNWVLVEEDDEDTYEVLDCDIITQMISTEMLQFDAKYKLYLENRKTQSKI